MDLVPVASGSIPSSYSTQQRQAALGQIQALTNQYNAELAAFAQAFQNEVTTGKVYWFDLAALVRDLLHRSTFRELSLTGPRRMRAVAISDKLACVVRHHARDQDLRVGLGDVPEPVSVPLHGLAAPRDDCAQVRRPVLRSVIWSGRVED